MTFLFKSGFLAQLSNFIPPDPPPLPSPPLLQRLLLEEPLALTATLIVAGVAAFFFLNSRGQARRGIAIGLVLVALGSGVFGLATAVTTRRERLIRATGELVGVTARVDQAGMDRMLADDVRLFSRMQAPGLNVPAVGVSKDALIELARTALSRYPIKEQYVRKVQAVLTGPNTGRSQVMVRVVVDGAYSGPHLSWWRITWREEGGAWRATEIEPVEIPGARMAE